MQYVLTRSDEVSLVSWVWLEYNVWANNNGSSWFIPGSSKATNPNSYVSHKFHSTHPYYIPWFHLLSDPLAYDYTPRLFHLSSASGMFLANEVLNTYRSEEEVVPYPFLQSDIYNVHQPGKDAARKFSYENQHCIVFVPKFLRTYIFSGSGFAIRSLPFLCECEKFC